MQIIPAIDIIDGRCVRLTEGDFDRKTVYDADPADMAKRFADAGLSRLHLVDLDGAKAGRVRNWAVLESVVAAADLEVDFGGGVKTEDEVRRIIEAGAAYVTVGSIAVKNEPVLLEWFGRFGADRFLLGADVRKERISIGGWLEDTSIDIFDFLEQFTGYGVRQVFCTDVSKDGRMEGPSIDLYRRILDRFPQLGLIASGGVSCMEDLEALRALGCSGAILGKAIYEEHISLPELTAFSSQ
jgi:phosphoribosylformimino-5-aminoimidazole carboxamide ribotide isomerase